MTPNDMPRQRPKHIWTPPANKRDLPVTPPAELVRDNSHTRRIRRRASAGRWARQIDDVN